MKLENIKPFKLGEKTVDGISILQITFSKMLALYEKPVPKGIKASTFFMRERMKVQTKLTAGTEPVVLDDTNIGFLPVSVGNAIIAGMTDEQEGVVGEVVNSGDGIENPVLYKLGSPIKFQGGKEITELEFMAKTFGDVEDVVSSANEREMTLALLEKLATPIGKGVENLPRLTSAAIDQISLADGIEIMTKITPNFFVRQGS